MTSKRELEEEISDLRWELGRAASAVTVEKDRAELYRREVERLREEATDLRVRLYGAGKALEVLAPMLYRRYSSEGVLRWGALIADAKRVEEYNATTEVLHFIEASQEREPF